MFFTLLIESLGSASPLALLGTAAVGSVAVLFALWHDDRQLPRGRDRPARGA